MRPFHRAWGVADQVIRSFRSSLKYKLMFYFLALSVFPIMLAGYVFYVNTMDLMVKKDTDNSIALNLNKIGNLDRMFANMETIAGEITTSVNTTFALKNITGSNYETDRSYSVLSDIAAKMESLKLSNDDIIDSIYILPQAEGGIPIFKGYYNTSYNGDLKQLPIYKLTVASPSRMIWHLDKDPVTGANRLSLSKAITDVFDDQVLGVCVMLLNLDNMMQDIEQSSLQRGELLYIVGLDDHQMIYHPDHALIGKKLGDPPGMKAIWQSKSGHYEQGDGKGKTIVTFTESQVNGWKIVDEFPYSNAVKGVDKITRITIAITIFVGLAAALIAIFVYLNLYRPIYSLMRGMKAMERGNFNVRVNLKRQDELGGLAHAFNYLTTRVGTLIEDVKLEQKTKKDMEVRALQAQITPHFLYNTLNAVKSLARLGRTEDIGEMTGAIIDLLRISASQRSDTITIREELNYVQSYVKIMEYRYNQTLHLPLELDESLLSYGILKFTIQPIVENCIIHAFPAGSDNRVIAIKLTATEEAIQLIISDNGSGFDPSVLASSEERRRTERKGRMKFSGMGIRNIDERLRLHYGERYGLRYEAAPGQGTVVFVTIPYIELQEQEPDA